MCQLWLLTAATCLSVVFTGFGCISLVGAMAVYYKGKYWMITTNDMEYKFDLNKDIAFIVVQPERPSHKALAPTGLCGVSFSVGRECCQQGHGLSHLQKGGEV